MMGPALALASAVCWAIANMMVQGVSRRIGSWSALVYVQASGALIALIVAVAVEGPLPAIAPAAGPLAVSVLGACLAYAGLFEALRTGQVAIVTPIIASWSAMGVAVGVIFFDAPLSTVAAVGVALVLMGNATLALSTRGDGATSASAFLWAGLSAVGFATMVLAVDSLGAQIGRLWTIPAIWIPELAILTPALALTGRMRRAAASDAPAILRTTAFELGGFMLLTTALAHAPVTLVSPLSSMSTAFAVLLGLAVLRERLSPQALLGATLVSGGAILVNL